MTKKKTSLAGIAGIVALATLISKIFGLFREQAIAAAFGVGPVVNAYAYAYVIPGFLLILLGGINGPFHSALVSVLSKRDKSEAANIVETVSTVVSLVLLGVGGVLILYAGFFIDILAPGLDETTRSLAILQLRIMSPLAVLAGLIGIGFGTLNAADQYWLPSISPLFSSLAVLIGLGVLAWQVGGDINTPDYIRLGGVVLAGGTLAGGVLQWGAQLWAQMQSQLGKLRLRFDLGNEGVKEVLRVMTPATLSSGMLHINVYTDLFFASYIAGAAAAMRYANFIVLTPLGIISNMILVPFMPVFSKLAAPENWDELKNRIRQGILLTALTMLPLTAIFMSLSGPIVEVIYQRYAFSADAARFVAPVLMTYGFGMFFYLARDVLVRVFYALGDGETPFRVSLFNIFLNAGLDYVLVNQFQTPGLVMATIGVNVTSMLILIGVLNRRLDGLPLREWGMILLALFGISAVAGLASFGVSQFWQGWLGTDNIFWLLGDLIVCSGVAVSLFMGLAMLLQLPELNLLVTRLKQKFFKRG
ncbi:murein biosynthesis integral membrane protein MurJ [Spirulina sp. CS-785/01]|uniref:murein biosynthesis integral membrane protein MurJ n=1 Tax=Spirulina sp. CS-785/01 TaxID=3021716 RepID=UPI00232A826C|nr:murein biosynthesis integral membrane protein MurJ [Spirulina sp. CS-785/01]MDB9315122.1 murein biosynthesis integral membrane protein MurJ [Spirulina sp. CS-785/01]